MPEAKIVVTGAAGFIGSNLVRALVAEGHDRILLVDRFDAGVSRRLLAGPDLAASEHQGLEWVDKDIFERMAESDDQALGSVEVVFHLGACTDTTERDRELMMNLNLSSSQIIARFCQRHGARLIYASSASVYGTGTTFLEAPENEAPINEYAESKKLFDDWVRAEILPSPSCQIVGLRYFNVYGPREFLKGPMASVAYKMHGQLADTGKVQLFSGSHGFGDGEQSRDFVTVEDVVDVNLWFMAHPEHSGIFNCGTGVAASFNAVAAAVLGSAGHGRVEYVPFPDELRERYQAWTCADLSRLREVGYDRAFCLVEEGVPRYMKWLARHDSAGP